MRCRLDLHFYPSKYIDMRKYYIDLYKLSPKSANEYHLSQWS